MGLCLSTEKFNPQYCVRDCSEKVILQNIIIDAPYVFKFKVENKITYTTKLHIHTLIK